MPKHYIDKEDWRDTLFKWIVFIIVLPIGIVLRLLLGERRS